MKPLQSIAAFLTAASLAGCAVFQAPTPTEGITAFSSNTPGSNAPRHWQPLVITRTKAPTQYRLVYDEQARAVVVHARSERSATGLRQPLDLDPAAKPQVAWRWWVQDLIAGADFQRAFGERPGRLVGIGIMTDTDNTGAEIEAFYGDIELRTAS